MTTTPVTPIAPPPQAPPQKSGCWKWGAIGCVIVLLLLAGGMAVIGLGVFGMIKRTDAYKESLRRAQNDPRVIEAIGSPVKPGFIVTGNVKVNNNTGNADIDFKVSGPKGKATVHTVATLDPTGWTYTNMTATPENGTAIDLLHPPGQ
jgi:hypothetical protein